MMIKNLLLALVTLLIYACNSAPEPADSGNTINTETNSNSVQTTDDHELQKTEEKTDSGNEIVQDVTPEPEKVTAAKPREVQQVQEAQQEEVMMSKDVTESVAKPFPKSGINHAAFDQLLSKFVGKDGKVNYQGLKEEKAILDAYCQMLTDNPVQDSWNRQEKMAYWINAYNAFTLQLITENYPISSILKLDGGKTWDVRRIKIGDKSYSLNNIENDILRPEFKDPRIHFAVNCAAKSCPPLWNHAYNVNNLESTLQARTREFINNKAFNSISRDQVEVSKIFEWYASDFGALIPFLNKYSNTQIGSNASIRYSEYNWDLNK
ncbi:MAG: DUF547 domain-containing protein [Lewinellaceae bacterium]|nr:DUF547 domain-containing protein [Lewinellaceae bacterium]